MLLALLSSLVLTQAEPRGPVGVVLTSRRPNTETFSPKIAARVVEVLKREGVDRVADDAKTSKDLKAAGFSDPRTCNGGQSCTARLAVLLGAHAVVVGIDVGKVGKSLAIHLEAFAADASEPLAVVDVSAREDKWADQTLGDFTAFARDVKNKLVTASPRVATAPDDGNKEPTTKRQPDAPVAKRIEPVDDLRDTPTPTSPSRVPAIVVASAAGGTAVVAGIFSVLALISRGEWGQNVTTLPDGTLGTTTLTQAQVTMLSQSVNTRATVALTTGLVALALGGVATWLFLKDPAPAAR